MAPPTKAMAESASVQRIASDEQDDVVEAEGTDHGGAPQRLIG